MQDVLSLIQPALEGRYAIEKEIGRGGMGIVYLARDLKLERQVAIKVLRPELSQAVGAERFLREVRIEASLDHPNIVSLFDSGEADGVSYYVMPFVEGESLRSLLGREERLSVGEVVRITKAVAEGLEHAHAHGVIHRDIKPENIILSDERVLIADFGIAKATSEASAETLSTYGLVLGTPEYMSPEQAMDDKVDQRTDIYALGCVVYEMLAGDPPFTGRTRSAVVAKHLKEHVPALDVVRADIPRGVEQAVEKALKKVPGDRFSSAMNFADALEAGRDTGPFKPPIIRDKVARTVKVHPILTALAVVAIVVLSTPLVRSMLRDGEPRVFGRPQSLIVLPYHTATTTEQERELVVELAALISMELNNWESIRAVPRVSLAGPMFDLGVTGPTLEVIQDGIQLARDANVEALLAVTLDLRRDTALVDALLYDAGTGRPVASARPLQARGHFEDPVSLVGPIVQGILGLGDVPLDAGDLRRKTHNPDALQQEIVGLRHLERWRLSEAEQSFRRAIEFDSTFAVGMIHLAQTLYWQASEGEKRFRNVGPEMAALTAAAVRYSSGLTTRDSLHIRAFHSFQEGDYAAAREFYRSILERDPSDVYAWLLAGTVEYRDPWLAEDESGELAPRGNLQFAVDAFLETVRLQPTFYLGYGHLFDISRSAWRAVDLQACPGFEKPRAQLIRSWEILNPQNQIAFCAVSLDSLFWMRKAVFQNSDLIEANAGADQLIQRVLARLTRWVDFAPDDPKPREELVAELLRRRTRLGVTAPERIDSLTRLTLDYLSQAIALKSDTIPRDLLDLGRLHMATGDLDSAIVLTELALEGYGSDPTPSYSVNPFLVAGQPLRAFDILPTRSRRIFVRDSLADSLISFGGGEPILDRLRVLGALGVSGPRVQDGVAEIRRPWLARPYVPRQEQILRQSMVKQVAIALAFDESARSTWFQGCATTSPLIQALLHSDSDSVLARHHLTESLESEAPGFSESTRSFIHGLVASRLSDHALAAAEFSRLDSIPLRLNGFDVGWALRAHSYLLRAESYEAIGEQTLAAEYYERLTREWAGADALGMVLLLRAREGLSRTRE